MRKPLKKSQKKNKSRAARSRISPPPKKKSVKKISRKEKQSAAAPIQASLRISEENNSLWQLPQRYNEDKLMLLVRDPWWIFAYWEVTPEKGQAAVKQARRAGESRWQTVLRVYDVSGCDIKNARSYFDIELNFYADNWYVDVGLPDHEWMAELGLRTASGKFIVLLRSNRVHTPLASVSSVIDEQWMLPDEIFRRIIEMNERGMGSSRQPGSSYRVWQASIQK